MCRLQYRGPGPIDLSKTSGPFVLKTVRVYSRTGSCTPDRKKGSVKRTHLKKKGRVGGFQRRVRDVLWHLTLKMFVFQGGERKSGDTRNLTRHVKSLFDPLYVSGRHKVSPNTKRTLCLANEVSLEYTTVFGIIISMVLIRRLVSKNHRLYPVNSSVRVLTGVPVFHRRRRVL